MSKPRGDLPAREFALGVAAICLFVALGATAHDASGQDSDPFRESAVSEWIVFVSSRSGNGDVYAADPTSGTIVGIASTDYPEGSPRYDSSNDRVVYQRFEDGVTKLTSGGSDLFEDPSAENAPSWSPDGWWIVYSDVRGGKEDLFIARPNGKGEKRLTNDVEIDRYPTWSPDGSAVLFARKDSTGWRLCSVALGDVPAGPKPLTEGRAYVGHPAWSPDGKLIAFDVTFDGQAEIAILDVDSGAIERLTDRPGHDLAPAWSSDARTIAFAGQPDDTGNWDVWTLEVASRRLTRVTTAPEFDGGPVFVPRSALASSQSRPAVSD